MAFTPKGYKPNQSGFDNQPLDYTGDYSRDDVDNNGNPTHQNMSSPATRTTNTNTQTPTQNTNYVRTRRFGEGNSNTNSGNTQNSNNENRGFTPRRPTPVNNQRPSAQPSQYSQAQNKPSNNDNGGTQRFNQAEHQNITQQAQNRRNSALSNFIPAGAAYQRSAPSLAYQEKVKANDTNMRFSFWGNARTERPMRYPLEIEKPTPVATPSRAPVQDYQDNYIPPRSRSGFEVPLDMPEERSDNNNSNSVAPVANTVNNTNAKNSTPAYHVNRQSDPEKNFAKLPETYRVVSENEQILTAFDSAQQSFQTNESTSMSIRNNSQRFAILAKDKIVVEPKNFKDVYEAILVRIDLEQANINAELDKQREELAAQAALEAEKKPKKSSKKNLSETTESDDNVAPTNGTDDISPKKRAPNTNFKPKGVATASQFQTQNHNFEGSDVSDLEKTGLNFNDLLNLSNIQINAKTRYNVQELSSIPIDLLLEILGGTKVDKETWTVDKHTIQIQEKSFKWFNTTTNKGSDGSINLMKHFIAIESDIVEHENNATLFKAACQRLNSLLPELLALYEKKNHESIAQSEEVRKQQYQKLIKAIDNIPLMDVMNYFQGKNHHKGIAGRWKVSSNGNVYSIGSGGWYSFTESVGGHGSIGFAAHILALENNLNYNDKEDNKKIRRIAINLLKKEFKNEIDLDADYDDVPVYSGDYKVPFSMPLVIPAKKNQVRNYLHDKRGLPHWMINKQMATGLLFPGFPSDWKLPENFKDAENLEDKNVWAVFLAMNGNAAEMRGIDRYDGKAKLLAKGSEKESGGHLVKAEKELSEGMVCSLEAAIDACSYASIYPGRVTHSCMGVNYNLAATMAVETLENGFKYGLCFDNDLAGNINNYRFKEELIKRIGEEAYQEFYDNGKIDYFQLGVLCLQEQMALKQRFYFDVNYDSDGKNTFKMFHEQAVKTLGLSTVKELYQTGQVFAYNVTPDFNLLKENQLQSEATRVADLLLTEKKPIYFVTEEPTLDKSEADIPEKIEEFKISLIKHNNFMKYFKEHLGDNFLSLQKQGSIIKNINSFAKDWNEYLNKMKKLHPEFSKQQQEFEEKFADTYNGDIQLDKVAGKIQKKR